MAALAATNSATASLQSTLNQSRFLQARREADQAEATAQRLRQQADEQERVVDQAHQRVQTLEQAASNSSNSAPRKAAQPSDPTYLKTLATVSPSNSSSPTASARLQSFRSSSSGQGTGRLINIRA
jgi:hypothetical protein